MNLHTARPTLSPTKMSSERVDHVYGPMSNRLDGTFAEWVPPPEEEPSMEELKKTNRRLAGDMIAGWKKLEAKDAELAEARAEIHKLKLTIERLKSSFTDRVEELVGAIQRENEYLSYRDADRKQRIAELEATLAQRG